MKNMTPKEKFWFIFLQVITLGLIWIHWVNKKKQIQKNNEFSFSSKTSINVKDLIDQLGGIDNINNVEFTYKKVKITYKDRNKISIESLKKVKGISGVFLNELGLTLIVGPESKALKEAIQQQMSK